MKKYVPTLIVSILFVVSSVLFKPFDSHDTLSRALFTLFEFVLVMILLFLSLQRHYTTKEILEIFRKMAARIVVPITVYLFPIAFLCIAIGGDLVFFNLPDVLVEYFARSSGDVALNILRATFWGNTAILVWMYGSLSVGCIILFPYLKWIKKCFGRGKKYEGTMVNFGGVLVMTVLSIGVVSAFSIAFTFIEDSFGIANRYYKDIKCYQEDMTEEYSGLVVARQLESMESARYDEQSTPLQLLIGYYAMQPKDDRTKNIRLHCPVEILKDFEFEKNTNYTVRYLPNTNIVTSISLVAEP